MTERPEESRGWELAAFALPAAPLLALSLPPIIFLPPYYNQHLGIDLATISAIFLAARVLDLVVNPMIGGLQDRTVSRFGRRKTWLLLGTPVMMLAIWAAFIALPPGTPALLLGLVVMSFYSSFAALMIAHLGWAGELRPTYHGRTRVLGAVQAASTIGQVGVLVVPALVQMTGLGDFTDGVRMMGWSLLVALPLCMAVTLLSVREETRPPGPRMDARAAFEALAKNRSLRAILLPDFLIGMVQGVSGSLFVFYFQYGLGFAREAEALLLVYFVAGLAGVPIWVALGHRLGKHRALQIGCIWWALALAAVPFVPKASLSVAVAAMAIAGLAQSAGVLLLRAMMADVVDEDEVMTGVQRSGLFFGLLLTTTKIGLAMGPLTYAILALFGFDAKLGAANTPEAMLALTFLFAGAPFVLNLAAALSLQGYPLTQARQQALRAEIEARRAPQATPATE